MSLHDVENLETLPFRSAVIRELLFVPQRKFELNLQTAPFVDEQRGVHVSQIYEVKFMRIGYLTLDIKAEIWLELISITVRRKSDFLDSYARGKREYKDLLKRNEDMLHFTLTFDEGFIDLVAEDVSIALIDELPAIQEI